MTPTAFCLWMLAGALGTAGSVIIGATAAVVVVRIRNRFLGAQSNSTPEGDGQ